MPFLRINEQNKYESPKIRIELSYATFYKDENIPVPLKLTIESDIDYDNTNHRWELYYTDVPVITRLYLLLRQTPVILKKFFRAQLEQTEDLQYMKNKLNGLITKYKEIEPCPHPGNYTHLVVGEWFLWIQFVPPPSQLVTISYFVQKVLNDLSVIKNITLGSSPCVCEKFRKLGTLITELNKYIKFLHRVSEDFLIFLRFLGDLEKYLDVRDSRLYNLEMEQYLLLKTRLRTELKEPFKMFSKTDVKEMCSKLMSNELSADKWTIDGYADFVHCPRCP